MAKNGAVPKTVQFMVGKMSTPQLVRLLKSPFIQDAIASKVQRHLLNTLKASRSDPNSSYLPSVQDDRIAMGIAITESIHRALKGRHLSDAYLRGMLQVLIKTLFIDRGNPEQQQQFQEAFGKLAPSFLLLAPGKACNLRCPGCYSDSDDNTNTLEWSIVDRVIEEAKSLWGERFFVISGGEPFVYRSEGKGIMELFEKHQDCFFMVYTNGALIDDQVSRRLSQAGNALLCLSVEGFKERTDARRGAGIFDRVVEVMDRLSRDGVPFGVSLTATRDNAEEILTDEFIDFVMKKGALLAFIFHYMPIGLSFTLDLMPAPEQRAWMWKRSWEIVREKQFFVADFWNHGTCIDGCIAAGGHGIGGYFYIDWNGAVTPCVFMPYSPVNIRDVYARGKTLNDVWQEPFFQAIRQWQYDYVKDDRNMIAPCPNRDHHDELEQLLMKYKPEPTDTNAAEALIDPEYTRGLVAYSQRFEAITGSIWENRYLHRKVTKNELFAPLPDIPVLDKIEGCEGCKSPEELEDVLQSEGANIPV
ncbi:MAG: radical SAM protein [Coprothermobacterota bacterium]|nr:radical SAM protein [Coprothermobacterota bacterium]